MTETADPTIDYTQRAGVAAPPPSWPADQTSLSWLHTHTAAKMLTGAGAGTTFAADFSVYQTYFDYSYPYSVAMPRLDSGWSLDSHLPTNWSRIDSFSRVQAAPGYVVFRPGNNGYLMSRLKSFFGNTNPPKKLAVTIDMESAGGFAGPGNHSAEANALALDIASWLGTEKKVLKYGNGSDLRALWPQALSWIRPITANYGGGDPSPYAWQYYGGLAYSSPAGYPRSCAPFGSWVDMNVFHYTTAQILEDLGMAAPLPVPADPGPDRLVNGQSLRPGERIYSNNRTTTLSMQTDGNLVVYVDGRAKWQTGTSGEHVNYAAFQDDGNFVLYAVGGHVLWTPMTQGKLGNRIKVQDDGNVVMYTGDDHVVWQTATNR